MTRGREVRVIVVLINVLVVRVFPAVLVYCLRIAAATLHRPAMGATAARKRARATGRCRGHRAVGCGGGARNMGLGIRGACGESGCLSGLAGLPTVELALHTLLERKPEAAVS